MSAELVDVGLRPELWILATIGFGLVALAVLIVLIGDRLGAEDGHFFAGSISLFFGLVVVVTWVIMLIPFDTKYHHLYHVAGEISSVSNVLSESSGDLTRTPIVQMEGSNVSYAVEDSRVVNLEGSDVTLLCSIEFVYLGADRYNCLVAEVRS